LNASLLCVALGLASDPAALQTLDTRTVSKPQTRPVDDWLTIRGNNSPVAISAYQPSSGYVLTAAQPGPAYVDGSGPLNSPPDYAQNGIAQAPGYAYPGPQPGYDPYSAFPKPYWYPSDWTVEGGAVFLKREELSSVALITSPGVVVNAADFDFDYETGVEVSISRVFAPGYQLELRYFNLDEWSDTRSVALPAAAGVIGTNPVTAFVGTAVLLDYSSQLQTFEANVRTPINPWLNVFAGFRWVDLDENMRANFTAPAPFVYSVDVDNDLYGLQLGADGALWDGGILRLEYFGKFGVFANDASQTSALMQPAPPLFGNAGDNSVEAALLAELGLTGVYQITPNWAIRGGYSIMWIDGVAEAADQTPNTTRIVGPAAASLDTGTVFYHGAHLSLELSW